MKSLKILSIVGLVWFGICFLCLLAFNNSYDYESAVGWGIYAVLFGVALAIVALVQIKRIK